MANASNLGKSRYRADIDGMRALAVVPVCLFHAGLPLFPGGFAGVDVFFVISGYLMAILIGEDLSARRFSLTRFYERRARRILPALFTLLLACAVVAAMVIPPKLFRDFGATLIGTVLFASNIIFWRKSANYFDASTDWNPLLHTWSLGIEEQFYIVFPLLLIVLWKLRPYARFYGVAAIALLSLGLSVWGTANAPTATFYLLPMRAWELLLGALVALYAIRMGERALDSLVGGFRGALSLIGLLLILASLLLFSPETPFPGAAALAPCVGTALLLACGRSGSTTVVRLLSIAPLRFIGRISYSLYLWHWPILVFAGKYLFTTPPSPWTRVALLIASCIAAYASWRWIEQPFRSSRTNWNSARLATAAGAAVVLFSIGTIAVAAQGWPSRFPGIESVSLDRQVIAESSDLIWKRFDDSKCFVAQVSDWAPAQCMLSGHGEANALLWGDSFAASYAYGFLTSGRSKLSILEYTSPQCPPILGYAAASRPQCKPFDAMVPAILGRYKISTVIMAANWASYFGRRKLSYADIADTVDLLKRRGVRVIVIGQSPVFPFAYPDEYYYERFGAREVAAAYATIDVDSQFNKRIAKSANPDEFFDPLQFLCRASQCRFRVGSNYLFSDYGHFSLYGSRVIVGALLDALKLQPIPDERPLPGT